MKISTGLLALGLLCGVGSGCGQTSYFEVTVLAGSSVPTSCLSTIDHSEVKVTGGGGEFFSFSTTPVGGTIGVFQYATDKESGNVAFTVDLVTRNGGMLQIIASGASTPTPIKSGGRQAVNVTTDLAAGVDVARICGI